mmetsp:Transcript_85209/g.237887  ORF Transcript_85209/g.237887 Transcript_85209/m.237887 type:complete len:321 (-) Transcript_85209:875-1837(-)
MASSCVVTAVILARCTSRSRPSSSSWLLDLSKACMKSCCRCASVCSLSTSNRAVSCFRSASTRRRLSSLSAVSSHATPASNRSTSALFSSCFPRSSRSLPRSVPMRSQAEAVSLCCCCASSRARTADSPAACSCKSPACNLSRSCWRRWHCASTFSCLRSVSACNARSEAQFACAARSFASRSSRIAADSFRHSRSASNTCVAAFASLASYSLRQISSCRSSSEARDAAAFSVASSATTCSMRFWRITSAIFCDFRWASRASSLTWSSFETGGNGGESMEQSATTADGGSAGACGGICHAALEDGHGRSEGQDARNWQGA